MKPLYNYKDGDHELDFYDDGVIVIDDLATYRQEVIIPKEETEKLYLILKQFFEESSEEN